MSDIDAVLARVREATNDSEVTLDMRANTLRAMLRHIEAQDAKIAAALDRINDMAEEARGMTGMIARQAARVETLSAALREARVIVDEAALFVSERGTHRVGGIAAQVRDRIDAALAGKE